MSSEPAILARVRETLEAVLPAKDAAAVMLDALSRWGPRVPADVAEMGAFVAGPLTASIAARIERERALPLLAQIEDLVATAAAPTQQHRAPDVEVEVLAAAELSEPEIEVEIDEGAPGERTATLPTADGPVPVLVIAGGAGLASRLRASLGPERVAVIGRNDAAGIASALDVDPLVIVIDATDVPAARAEDVVAQLRGSRGTAAVWGADLPFGRRAVDLCERDRIRHVALRTGEGVELLLDLILSRS